MPAELVKQLDAMGKSKGYSNRSQAVADMVRAHLVEHHAESGNHEIAGALTLVYDHHRRGVQEALTRVQHDNEELIVSVLHVHLNHSNCMEVLAVRGKAGAVKKVADLLLTTKGVKHGKLTVTTTGEEFK
jgi:CopG family nickel-responsive transcriptional regulator